MLLVNHHSLNKGNDFWAPPGGGMDFGQSAEENLQREFLEDTGLKVDVEKFLCIHEYLKAPLHAIELIFKVKGYFGPDGWFAFGAIYGFLACLAMVLVAKGLGYLLKRPHDYYREADDD